MGKHTMADAQKDITDGSSIVSATWEGDCREVTNVVQKPVSSLRSHFEQMAKKGVDRGNAPPPVGPKPRISMDEGHPSAYSARSSFDVSTGLGIRIPRGQAEGDDGGARLRPADAHGFSDFGTSPTRSARSRPVSVVMESASFPRSPPAVTIDSPRSPPKTLHLDLTPSNEPLVRHTTGSLTTPSKSGSSSPAYFKIPTRPQTPLLDPRNPTLLPASRTPASHPPEPPPPRRSGEMRRDTSFRNSMGPPPPVNRAEKPQIGGRTTMYHSDNDLPESAMAQSVSKMSVSPFSTPPRHTGSPELVGQSPDMAASRTSQVSHAALISQVTKMAFEPPPVHHAVANRRLDQEVNGLGRSTSVPYPGDRIEDRPALPARRDLVPPDLPSPRGLATSPRLSIEMRRPPFEADRSLPHENGSEYSGTPKRVFSTPTTQSPITPRTHARSMTVTARPSARLPEQMPTPALGPLNTSKAKLHAIAPSRRPSTDAPRISFEYPDSRHTNRRPPSLRQGVPEIIAKIDGRVLDVCGEYICTSGHFTRVWSMLDGELLMSLAHGDNIKIMAIAFKPMANIEDEGSRIWLGNNVGDLLEVDIPTQRVVASREVAHTRREVIKIHRCGSHLWTLDDGGTLHIWDGGSIGSPSLTHPTQSYRLPKGHTFSIVVGLELWHATGKEIRVYKPTADGRSQFQILQRPLQQEGVGGVTSGAVLSSRPDRVYFGHTDGKVSIYAIDDYSCLGVVNVSVYKINSLAGIGDYLWAGYNTGMIYVYDTSKTPWIVKKDWQAHAEPVLNIVADRSSFWKLGGAHVVSLGADSAMRPWDGLLQEDWMGMFFRLSRSTSMLLTPS